MIEGRDVYITWGDNEVYLRGRQPDELGLFVSGDGIEGWDSAPDAKVDMTERQAGDGAHSIDERQVLYSARTVIVNFHAHGADRDDTTALLRRVSAACHHIVRLRVVDGTQDTYVTGYVQPTVEAEWFGYMATGQIEVVCADPRRYSTQEHTANLIPLSNGSGGLFYGDSKAGLVYPLDYGESASDARNIATVENAGTSEAYPTIWCYGSMDGIEIHSGERRLVYSQPVTGVPVSIDCLNGTASVAGTDTTRYLTSRGFPSIPAGGSALISLQSYGTGFCTVSWHDTYI